jgi:hypothetical protein
MSSKNQSTAVQKVDPTTGEIAYFDKNFVPTSWMDMQDALSGDIAVFEGSPYKVLSGKEGKKTLEGKEFMIISYDFNEGDYGEFVTVRLITPDNELYIINDGSTGIYAQLKELYRTSGRKGGIHVKNGLRASDFTYVEKDFDGNPLPDRKPVPATTWYLA